jgi:hypothetical protein
MPADPNKQAVYRMEKREFAGVWLHVKQPMKYLQRRANAVCRLYEVPTVRLRVGRVEGGCAEYDSVDRLIRIDDRHKVTARNLLTVAHELAHHIVWERHGNRAQDHGPMFVLVYGQVLSSLRLCPFAGWRAACKRHGVKMAAWRPHAASLVSSTAPKNRHRGRRL